MQKAWSTIKGQAGMSVVEVLLAATAFGMLVVSIGGAIIYSYASIIGSGDRDRAVLLANEGLEAARNLRDNSYNNLTDGTFGLTQTSNQWALSGTSDTSGIYTRQLTIASGGTDRKTVTSNVNWSNGSNSRQVSIVTQLTNWMASLVKSWTRPIQYGALDINSTNNGIKVATRGNYAYLVRNDGTPDFIVLNISNPAAPSLVGSLSLTGAPTNIAVSGNYAYVTSTTDNGELQVVDISNPAAPVYKTAFDAAGTADGTAVFISGNYAYLTRKANGGNNEFVAINVTNPLSPSRVGWYNLNVNMNDIYVSGADVYIASDSDSAEVIELSNVLLGLITLVTTVNLPGTANGTAITGFSSGLGSVLLLVGQETTFYTVDGGLTNSVIGTLPVSGYINDLDVNTGRTFAYIGTSSTSAEFQVINIATLASPTLAGTVDIAGTTSNLNGVAYNSSLDVVAGASASDTQEAIIFGPN